MAASQTGAGVGISPRVKMGVGLGKTNVGNHAEANLKEESVKEAVRRGAAVQLSAEVGINRRVGLGKTSAEANLAEANLAEANLAEANLAEANLAEANLAEANLAEANLAEVNLEEAVNLKEAVRMEAAMVATSSTRTGFLVRIIIIFSIITTANTIFIVVIVSITMAVSVSVILEANYSYFIQQHKDIQSNTA